MGKDRVLHESRWLSWKLKKNKRQHYFKGSIQVIPVNSEKICHILSGKRTDLQFSFSIRPDWESVKYYAKEELAVIDMQESIIMVLCVPLPIAVRVKEEIFKECER